MRHDEHTEDEATDFECQPWWRNSRVAFTIAFWAMIVTTITAFVPLTLRVVREFVTTDSVDWLDAIRHVTEQSFIGCTIAGFAAGLVFGVPLGVLRVLSERESRLALQQELDTKN